MMKWITKIKIAGLITCLLFFVSDLANAQLSMDVEISETLSNAQSIPIQSLVENDGRGPNLFRMYLQNNTQRVINDLYLRIFIESDKIGRIAEAKQVHSFSLRPGQQVFATNNNINNGLPGVKGHFQFDGDITPEGEAFVDNLKGSTSLPADTYRITIEIYKGAVGGELIVSESAAIGTNIVEVTRDLYLLSPGDVVGSDATISNSYPNFQWQGTAGMSYRLIVVESRPNESPQSLMVGAQSTEPIISSGSSAGGSLVNYEMLDVIVNQFGFQYPSSGVQNLEPGKKYYWRVISQLDTSGGVETNESEIWSFTLRDIQKMGGSVGAEGSRVLRQLLGNRYQEISQKGYSFQSVMIDGQKLQGGKALQKLMELGRRTEQGNVSIVIEDR